ncbi:TetR/AcrR family transcriptional regulator [Mycobacterium seoulense]|uniref:TetR/AcrR family transcriptional regulator n=1 Tax=Mycobacterium seoulense TaxID=386911 RepID=UPI003CF7A55D
MAMKPRERTPPWAAGAKTDRTREQILEGACLTFQELGYSTARVEQIAKRAGVSRPTFYVYFATKQDAFLAVAERSVARLALVLEALDELPRRPDDGDLASWVEQFFSYFDDFGAFATVWRQAAFADPGLQRSGWKAQRQWATRIGRNIDRLRGSSLGDAVSQGLAFEAMLESLWYSSIVNAPGRSRHSAQATATAMVKALIVNT